MKTNKKVVGALENIASELKELNATCRKCNNISELLLTNNEAAVKTNQKHYNLSLASILSGLTKDLGDSAVAYLEAVQEGDLAKANDIAMAKLSPKKRGRKPVSKKTEIKPEPKKRGRKPKQPQN